MTYIHKYQSQKNETNNNGGFSNKSNSRIFDQIQSFFRYDRIKEHKKLSKKNFSEISKNFQNFEKKFF